MCEGDGNAGVGSGGCVIAVSAYMGGSCVLSSACDVLEMSVVRCVGGVCDMCMCLARVGRCWWRVGEMIGLRLYQSWMNRGDVGYVSVFCLRWCWGSESGPGLRGWGGVMSVFGVSLYSLCLWQVQAYVYCARRIPAQLRCTQCSILLHLIDICYLTCICLWQISQIQTCLRVFVGP